MMNIFSAKSKTKKQKITDLKDPAVFRVPLLQHIGNAAEPVVSAGDAVKRYQLIGRANGPVSANVHSPVSGVVIGIRECPLADGQIVPAIEIENDFKYTELEHPDSDLEKLSGKDILEIIEEAGVVGEGGAGFPTHVKYDVKDKKIKTFILNGTECEPYLTSDYSLIDQFPSRLIIGALLINKILKAEEIIIAIEHQNKDLVGKLHELINKPENKAFKIKILPDQYPQGGELQLIKSLTGIEVKRGGLPADKGVIVSNVGTVIAVFNAVARHKPLVERVITVSGDNLQGAGNYMVKIGTPVSHIVEVLGLDVQKQIVLGGPMMGKQVTNFSVPIQKGSSAVLSFQAKVVQYTNCISCGYCVDICPMRLMPFKFAEYFRKEMYASMKTYNLNECIECAACQYICPCNVPLMESIKNGKAELNKFK
ncbi:electron transport complex protein RnfC [Dysgonomonas sp. PH5-45]|uniref:electron transport complex subunit RsxC n=1 Tax=unclassified Dysgonomonas TaxID=2630389 RepID=UPI002472F134|nr:MULTISPECIES: electron transport complex subunit RsxC [unclassified Dysgonomonas]MDH6354791.1 electron transport complex protein RnfC [Dysgonomonas sp. PH5-45]MDH6387690.1 electron transport complex protein RnfC [Dysgonomonas sp. PH5-37]